MSQPIAFSSSSPRFALPLLFQGQAQKEFYFNESMSLIDALLMLKVEGEEASAPVSPADGDCWLVASAAVGDWQLHDQSIAIFVAGSWNFIPPSDGMIVFDKASDRLARFKGTWQRPSTPTTPSGGAVIDQEARNTISEILDVLRIIAALPTT